MRLVSPLLRPCDAALSVGRASCGSVKLGGFCCPVPPGPRLPNNVRQRVPYGYRWHLVIGPITAVPCRAKTMPLPRASILFRPRRVPPSHALHAMAGKMVEAPGTAPGSAALIPHGVYRHSRLPDDIYIGLRRGNRKGQEAPWSRRGRAVNLRFTIFDSWPSGISMPLSAEQQAEVDALADATQPTRRATVPALEEILYKAIPVLDHGFVRVIDYMGDDAAAVQAMKKLDQASSGSWPSRG